MYRPHKRRGYNDPREDIQSCDKSERRSRRVWQRCDQYRGSSPTCQRCLKCMGDQGGTQAPYRLVPHKPKCTTQVKWSRRGPKHLTLMPEIASVFAMRVHFTIFCPLTAMRVYQTAHIHRSPAACNVHLFLLKQDLSSVFDLEPQRPKLLDPQLLALLARHSLLSDQLLHLLRARLAECIGNVVIFVEILLTMSAACLVS